MIEPLTAIFEIENIPNFVGTFELYISTNTQNFDEIVVSKKIVSDNLDLIIGNNAIYPHFFESKFKKNHILLFRPIALPLEFKKNGVDLKLSTSEYNQKCIDPVTMVNYKLHITTNETEYKHTEIYESEKSKFNLNKIIVEHLTMLNSKLNQYTSKPLPFEFLELFQVEMKSTKKKLLLEMGTTTTKSSDNLIKAEIDISKNIGLPEPNIEILLPELGKLTASSQILPVTDFVHTNNYLDIDDSCKHDNTRIVFVQKRSADEAMSTKILCNDCNCLILN